MTDLERLRKLHENGYLSNMVPVELLFQTPTQVLDWCLLNGMCPAYWRECKNDQEILSTCPPHGNGLVFVKSGDRERIDAL